MLDPGEVAESKSYPAVHSPYNACVHGNTKNVIPCNTPITPESLMKDGASAEEEDDDRTTNSIEHPTKYAEPAEEDILYTFLMQQRKLEAKASRNILIKNTECYYRKGSEEDIVKGQVPIIISRLSRERSISLKAK